MATPAGRRVLAARRKKGRKTLVPALVPKRKM
jgi:ribosomal protein L34